MWYIRVKVLTLVLVLRVLETFPKNVDDTNLTASGATQTIEAEVYDLLLRDKECRRVCRDLDKSADKVVDIHVAGQLTGTQS